MNQDRLERWDRPLAFLLLGFWLAVIIAATFVLKGATRIYAWPWAFYLQAGLLAPWFWCAWSVARGRTGLRSAWWVSLPLLAALALSILTSNHWHDALEASLVLATPLGVLPFLAQAWVDWSAKTRLLALRVLGAILAALSAWSLFIWFAGAPDSGVLRWFFSARNPHPLGHWNYNGGLALLALPVLLLLAVRTRGPERLAWIVFTGLGLALLLSTSSRGAVLGLVAALLVGAAALACRRTWSRRAVAGGIFILLLIAAAAVLANPRLRQIVADPASAFAIGESEQQRLGFILTGARIVAAHPWTGIGPGATPYHYPEYRVDIPGSLENSFQLHCGPVQWCVDTGFIGLALLAAAGGFLKWRLWKTRRTLSAEAIAAVTMLGGYGVMWLTDYQLDAPVYAALLMLAVAVFLAETEGDEQRSPTESPSRIRFLAPALVMVPLVGVIFLTPSWQARAAFSSAWGAKDAGDVNGFIKDLRAAADAAWWNPLYHNHLARALAGVAAHLPSETATALREEARSGWQRSITVAPAQDHPWLNLGWLDLAEGRPAEAAENFRRAAALQPKRGGLWFGIAIADMQAGENDTAAIALARQIRLNPAFITSPVWQHEPFVAIRRDVVARLLAGWSDRVDSHGASEAQDLAAFARWWWFDEAEAVQPLPSPSPTRAFLNALAQFDDREVSIGTAQLPASLHALRESWRSGAPVLSPPLPPDIAALWNAEVAARGDTSFSLLLKRIPTPAVRRFQRGADGLLFRQVDGDPLSDLTEMPAHALAAHLAPVLPRAALRDFVDPAWTTRLETRGP